MKQIFLLVLITAVIFLGSCKKNNKASIAPKITDVYMAETQSNSDSTSFVQYLKNGSLVILTDGKEDAESAGMFVSGNDVYIAGVERNKACYWKNNQFFSLPSSGIY